MDFETWMAAVNRLFWTMVGVGVDDLVDMCCRDWFDDGLTPVEAVLAALEDGVLS